MPLRLLFRLLSALTQVNAMPGSSVGGLTVFKSIILK